MALAERKGQHRRVTPVARIGTVAVAFLALVLIFTGVISR